MEKGKERGHRNSTLKPVFFNSAEDLRAWLHEHHADSRELLLGFYRKKLGRGISYPEALDEALAFGWIDGIRKSFDAEAYTIRFTPRKPGSIWSTVNIRRVKELTTQGLMQPSGLGAFANRDEEKTRQYSYERAGRTLDATLDKILRSDRKAASFFEAQPPGYRKMVVSWIMSGKKEETRLRRLTHMIELLSSGRRIDLLNPNKR